MKNESNSKLKKKACTIFERYENSRNVEDEEILDQLKQKLMVMANRLK